MHVEPVDVVGAQAEQAAVEVQPRAVAAGRCCSQRRRMEDKDVLVCAGDARHRKGTDSRQIDVGVRGDRLIDPQRIHILVGVGGQVHIRAVKIPAPGSSRGRAPRAGAEAHQVFILSGGAGDAEGIPEGDEHRAVVQHVQGVYILGIAAQPHIRAVELPGEAAGGGGAQRGRGELNHVGVGHCAQTGDGGIGVEGHQDVAVGQHVKGVDVRGDADVRAIKDPGVEARAQVECDDVLVVDRADGGQGGVGAQRQPDGVAGGCDCDADRGYSRVQGAIVDLEGEAVRSAVVCVGRVGQVRGRSAQAAVAWVGGDGVCQGVTIHIRTGQGDGPGGILGGGDRLGIGDRRIIDRGHRDGNRGRSRVEAAVVDLEGEAVGAVIVCRWGVGQVWGRAGERAVGRAEDDAVGQGAVFDIRAAQRDRQGGVFGRGDRLRGCNRRIVDRGDREAHRGRSASPPCHRSP